MTIVMSQVTADKDLAVRSNWGSMLIARVEVSSDASEGKGPEALLDGNGASVWQSDGPGPPHTITVFLKQQIAVRDFGILVDEDDGSYCPRRIRLSAGISDSDGDLVDIRVVKVVGDGSAGIKYVRLLEGLEGGVSVVRVLIEDSGGGCDCMVHGVLVEESSDSDLQDGAKVHSLKVGTAVRVKPSVKDPRFGWGAVTHSSFGILHSIDSSDRSVTLNFHGHSSWKGHLDEIEEVDVGSLVGKHIVCVCGDENADWDGCPGTHLSFSKGIDWVVGLVHAEEGKCFISPTEFLSLWMPLTAAKLKVCRAI